MTELFSGIGSLIREFGLLTALLIVAVAIIVYMLWLHTKALNRWAQSNDDRVKANEIERQTADKRYEDRAATAEKRYEDRIAHAEQRQDNLLVQNSNLNRQLIEGVQSHGARLDELLVTTKDSLAEQKKQTEKLDSMGSEYKRLCKAGELFNMTPEKFDELLIWLEMKKSEGSQVASALLDRLNEVRGCKKQ